MSKKHRIHVAVSMIVGSLLLVGANTAAAVGGSPYDVVVENAKVERDRAKAQCEALRGNDKDVCVKRADANFATTKANAEADRKGTTGAALTARRERLRQEYRVAREECDAHKGAAKELCIAHVNAAKERADARLTSATQQLQADYKLATVKCDQLSGNNKSACMAEAKNRYKPE